MHRVSVALLVKQFEQFEHFEQFAEIKEYRDWCRCVFTGFKIGLGTGAPVNRKTSILKSQSGIDLIGLIVSMALLGVFLTAILSMVDGLTKATKSAEHKKNRLVLATELIKTNLNCKLMLASCTVAGDFAPAQMGLASERPWSQFSAANALVTSGGIYLGIGVGDSWRIRAICRAVAASSPVTYTLDFQANRFLPGTTTVIADPLTKNDAWYSLYNGIPGPCNSPPDDEAQPSPGLVMANFDKHDLLPAYPWDSLGPKGGNWEARSKVLMVQHRNANHKAIRLCEGLFTGTTGLVYPRNVECADETWKPDGKVPDVYTSNNPSDGKYVNFPVQLYRGCTWVEERHSVAEDPGVLKFPSNNINLSYGIAGKPRRGWYYKGSDGANRPCVHVYYNPAYTEPVFTPAQQAVIDKFAGNHLTKVHCKDQRERPVVTGVTNPSLMFSSTPSNSFDPVKYDYLVIYFGIYNLTSVSPNCSNGISDFATTSVPHKSLEYKMKGALEDAISKQLPSIDIKFYRKQKTPPLSSFGSTYYNYTIDLSSLYAP